MTERNGRELAHALILMVAELHRRGYESLAIVPAMAPNGMAWRYAIGEIPPSGPWDALSLEPRHTRGSLGPARLDWADADLPVPALADAFLAAFTPTAGANAPHAAWLRQVVEALPPAGAFILASDYNAYERLVFMGAGPPATSELPMPPGLE